MLSIRGRKRPKLRLRGDNVPTVDVFVTCCKEDVDVVLDTTRAACAVDAGIARGDEAFVAKLYATEMSGRVTDRCLQVLGGLGYTKEVPIQSFYRQARLWRIGHGTSEIHRWMIARNLLDLPGKA